MRKKCKNNALKRVILLFNNFQMIKYLITKVNKIATNVNIGIYKELII